MPTQIIDGFKLNAATPIDSRLVTTGTASRNLMTYKYEGLRVYDTIQKKPFVYINGDWIEESGGVTTTAGGKIGGDLNYIPKITETGTTSSIIREYIANNNNRRIGINIPESTQIAATLHVSGPSKFDGQVTATNFVGSLAATHITGMLPLDNIANANEPTKTYVLKSINNKNNWVEEKIGSKINIENNTDYDKLFFAFTNDKDTLGVGNSLYIVNNGTNDLLAANSKTRQLMVGTNNTAEKPQYSFLGKLGTGMYGTNNEVGLSIDGKKSLYITSTMVGINVGGVTTMKFEPTLTTITGPAKINGPTTITGNTSITGPTTITGNTLITGLTTITGTGSVSMSLSVGNSLSVGGTLTGKTAVLTPDVNKMGISVTTNMFSSPPNKIINTNGTGLYIKSKGEGIRLDTMDDTSSNFISFFKNGGGSDLESGGYTNNNLFTPINVRRGWLGYFDNTDIFYISNEVGAIILKPATTQTLNLQSTYYRHLVMHDNGIKLMGYSSHYWYFSQNLTTTNGTAIPDTQRIPAADYYNSPIGPPVIYSSYTSIHPQYMVPVGGWDNPIKDTITNNTMMLINQITSKTLPTGAIQKTFHDQWFVFRSKSLHVRVMLNMGSTTTKTWVPINRQTTPETAGSAWPDSLGKHSVWDDSTGWTTDQFFIPGGWEFIIEIQKSDVGVTTAKFQGWGFSLGKVEKFATGGGGGSGIGGINFGDDGGLDYFSV